MTITWKQFKDSSEAQMKRLGLDENSEIEYIDFSWADKVSLALSPYPDGNMIVIS